MSDKTHSVVPKLTVSLFGATGKLGKAIGKLFLRDPQISLIPLTHSASRFLRQDYGELLGEKPLALPIQDKSTPSDLFIDVSSTDSFSSHVNEALLQKKPLVIGVTKLTQKHFDEMLQASQKIPIFYSPNFSVGALYLEKTASLLAELAPEAKLHIVETHHKDKKDAPSGTALSLKKALARIFTQEIPVTSFRKEETIGVHEVIFDLGDETLSFTHKVLSRKIFAEGVKRAALFLIDQPAGLYGMQDLIL